jgi:hypothetical protein
MNLLMNLRHYTRLYNTIQCHRIKIHTEGPLTSEALKFLSSRMSHYACWPPFSYVRKPPQMWYKLVINLESRFITDILPSDAARPRGQYISYKPPSRFITLTYKGYTTLYNTIQRYTRLYVRHYIRLYNTIRHYTIIYKTIRHYTTLYNVIQNYTALYKAIRHYTTLYSVIQDYTTLYKSIHHYTTLHNNIQGYMTLYNTLLNSDHLIGCLWSRDIE